MGGTSSVSAKKQAPRVNHRKDELCESLNCRDLRKDELREPHLLQLLKKWDSRSLLCGTRGARPSRPCGFLLARWRRISKLPSRGTSKPRPRPRPQGPSSPAFARPGKPIHHSIRQCKRQRPSSVVSQ